MSRWDDYMQATQHTYLRTGWEKAVETIDEHNARRSKELAERHTSLQQPCKAAVACPKCGNELYYEDVSMVLACDPPKKTVNCLKCDYRGYKVL